MKQDYSDKLEGQSREFLPKVAMAVEQDANFLQQGLTDISQAFSVEPSPGLDADTMPVKPEEVKILMERELKKSFFLNHIGDTLKTGLLSSLMITKVHGEMKAKYKYTAKVKLNSSTGKISRKLVKKEDKYWCLKLSPVRVQDYYCDPTNQNLYEMEDIYMDYYKVLQMANDGMYIKSVVEQLAGSSADSQMDDHRYERDREENKNSSNAIYRKTIKLTEFYGNILSADGELLFENVMCTVANDTYLIQKPVPIPFWHGGSPYVVAPIISVPGNKQGRALMDAPTMLNRAANEMFNLMLDGGMMAVHGIKQLRPSWLTDPSQVDNGVQAGTTLLVNDSCPPGQHAMERVDTSTIPSDGFTMFNLLNNEFYASALTNDLRMGVAPFRQVKATEVVEASQNISSMFKGMATQIEEQFVTPLLYKVWATIAQHMSDLDSDEVKTLIGTQRFEAIKNMTNEELFASTVEGTRFRVFGISENLNKQREFTKLQNMLQTIATSPILMQEFTKKYDFGKLLTEILKSLDINTYKIEHAEQLGGPAEAQPQPGTPNPQSQIPQAGSAANAEAPPEQQAQPGVPQTTFPASRATPAGRDGQ